jgi:glycosyltransferase involved in cell wall biosynthesis
MTKVPPTAQKTVVISAYPLSRAFRERLEVAIQRFPVYLNLAQLRSLGARRGLRALRLHAGGRWLLTLENESTSALMPFLAASALIAMPVSLEVLHGDLRLQRLSTTSVLASTLTLVRSSAKGLVALLIARRDLEALSRAERSGAIGAPGERKVLFVYGNLWFGIKAGGSVGHVAGVVNALGEAGYHVDLATSIEPVMVGSRARVIKLHPSGPLGLPFEANHYRVQRDFVSYLKHRVPVRAHRFLYYRISVASYAGVVLSRALNIPLVAEYNGSEVWAARNWGTPLRFEHQALLAESVTLRHAHVLVVVSEVLRDELVARGLAPERIVYHPNGVDPRFFNPDELSRTNDSFRRLHELPPDGTVVTFVGTFGRWHGVDVLARAIQRLVISELAWLERKKVRFLLIGDGLKMAEVRSILGAGTERFVLFAGLVPQEDTPAYLAASDVVVSPHVSNPDGSPFFGSPTKLFEYMVMGRGIVASDLGQIREVLTPALRVGQLPNNAPISTDPHVAVLATPGDVTQLIEGIRFLVDNPLWRVSLGARARERALEKYTWRHHVDAILKRIDELSSASQRST